MHKRTHENCAVREVETRGTVVVISGSVPKFSLNEINMLVSYSLKCSSRHPGGVRVHQLISIDQHASRSSSVKRTFCKFVYATQLRAQKKHLLKFFSKPDFSRVSDVCLLADHVQCAPFISFSFRFLFHQGRHWARSGTEQAQRMLSPGCKCFEGFA